MATTPSLSSSLRYGLACELTDYIKAALGTQGLALPAASINDLADELARQAAEHAVAAGNRAPGAAVCPGRGALSPRPVAAVFPTTMPV